MFFRVSFSVFTSNTLKLKAFEVLLAGFAGVAITDILPSFFGSSMRHRLCVNFTGWGNIFRSVSFPDRKTLRVAWLPASSFSRISESCWFEYSFWLFMAITSSPFFTPDFSAGEFFITWPTFICIAGETPIILMLSPVAVFVFIKTGDSLKSIILPSRSIFTSADGLPFLSRPEPIAMRSIICMKLSTFTPSIETILSPAFIPDSKAGDFNSTPPASVIFSGTYPIVVVL
ncbi:unknown [Coraliomargarita sp. CAG:312]|nr:unknown [Coraliomargarita sp. CAG:312]